MNQRVGQDPRPSPPPFTEKQGQYLAFIWAYTQIHARPPAERDLQNFFATTPPSVHQMMLTLERQGLIRRQPATARSVQILIPPEALPVLRSPQTVKTSETRY
jgi:DNA-binding MarR family transcriptional regulator